MRWQLLLLGFALCLGLFVVVGAARPPDAVPRGAPVAIEQRGAAAPLVLVFIDSLSREVATDAARMKYLNELARDGASFDVEPCRDQLTYLCLRAALSGHDESSLLAVADNFRPDHEGPPETLLSRIAERGGRISVVGSNDFHPYRRWLFSERAVSKSDETPENIAAAVRAALREEPALLIVSLASGDMAAHVHGTHSARYDEAFRRLDHSVRAIGALLGPEANLVVFGDHGHDELGRHLPGTWAKTWAVYRGAAVRPGVHAELDITDHRALLGTLLAVPSEANYGGPALATLLEPSWVQARLVNGTPKLERSVGATETTGVLWLTPALLLLVVLGIVWYAGRRLASRELSRFAALGVVSVAAVGIFYDGVRRLAHDHGDSPERALILLVPLGLGAALPLRLRRLPSFNAAARYWPRAAASILLACLLLLLPTAYYYGSRRAVVLAGILACALVLFDAKRRGALARAGAWPLLGVLFAMFVLATLYPVRQLGPETAGAATFALDAALYRKLGWLPLLLSKFVLFALVVAPRAARRPFDSACAVGLLTAATQIELSGARVPSAVYPIVLLLITLGGLRFRSQAPSSLLAGALLLLAPLYGGDPARIAPIEMILAGTSALLAAWRRLGASAAESAWFNGLVVALASYLMLWPTVGFHLAGIDFAFMFQWVPERQYLEAWQLIGFGVVVKLALPLLLIGIVAARALCEAGAGTLATGALAAKVALLSLLIACYAATHSMASQQATAMLAELLLVMFALTCLVLTRLFVTQWGRIERADRVAGAHLAEGSLPSTPFT
ncbi:MAG: alkaline phosphatase family protein [Polyangiaceae bacterium]